MKRPASDGGCKEKMTLAWHYAVMGRERFCMSVSVVSQVYEMTMLETNSSQKNNIDMSYRESMMC